MNSNLIDYQKWKDLNGEDFSLFDYLRGSLASGECSPDIVVSFARLLFPEFLEKEGMIFLKEQFSQEKFDQFRSQGMEPSKIEYWINLLAVSDLITSLPDSFVKELTLNIKRSWETCLAESYPKKIFNVDLIQDDDDMFLVFNQASRK